MIYRRQLQHHFTGNQAKVLVDFRQQRLHTGPALRFEFRCTPIVQRHATALFFEQQARVLLHEGAKVVENVGRQRRFRNCNRIIRVLPQFGSVGPGGGEPNGRENTIDFCDLATAYQRHRAAQAARYMCQHLDQGRICAHVCRMVLDIEQCPIDVQE